MQCHLRSREKPKNLENPYVIVPVVPGFFWKLLQRQDSQSGLQSVNSRERGLAEGWLWWLSAEGWLVFNSFSSRPLKTQRLKAVSLLERKARLLALSLRGCSFACRISWCYAGDRSSQLV